MQLLQNYWPILFNILLPKYFSHLTTTCILWHSDFELISESGVNDNVLLQINAESLSGSFSKDIYDFTKQDEYFNGNQVFYNELIKKYIAAIENSKCEGFLAFQDDIPLFAETFRKASVYSLWRSLNSRFIFAYVRDRQQDDLFQDTFFKNQPNILVIEADFMNSSTFYLKTNKFVGPRSHHPEEMILLSTFDALKCTFSPDVDLYTNEKLKDLQGREIIVAALDYRPYVAVDFKLLPQYYDHAKDNPTHLVHIDGIEARLCLTFCQIYNCTVQFDTSEKEEWGTSFPNFTGIGLIGMIINERVDMTFAGMYAWNNNYMNVDISTFLVRSGVTCLVPAPSRIISWSLPLRPFKLTLWLVLFVVLIIECICLLLGRKFEYLVANLETKDDWRTSCLFGFISAFKLFISQGTNYVVEAYTLRVILFACYMHDIIITSVYSGGLAFILTMPILNEAADSVDRMYSHDLKWASTSLAWVESLKDVHDDPLIMRLLANFRVFKYEEIREIAKTDNIGFAVEHLAFGHLSNLDFITPESINHLKLMVDDIYYGFTVAMVTRSWPHLPKYNDLIMAWHSSGFDKIWEWKITAEYLNVNDQNQIIASKYFNFDTGPVKLDMNNFGGIILVWLLGMCISMSAFVLELMVYKMCQRNLKLEECNYNTRA